MNTIQKTHTLGQSIWLDYIHRELITSGQLKRLIDQGLSGMTSNPTIFHKAITKGTDYDDAIRAFLKSKPKADTRALYDHLVIHDIQLAADTFRPIFEATNGMDGLVSLEPPAQLSYDTDATIAETRRLWRLANRPNIMMKVPATPQGIPAIETLIAEGININITLMFSMKHYKDIAHAYLRGMAKTAEPENISSVASFFVSRVDTYTDKALEMIGTDEALALRGKAAIANSKLVNRRFQEIFISQEFESLRERGAHIQRVLWGSTSTKNPAYPDTIYVDGLIGPSTVNTVPIETLYSFLDHGKVRRTIDKNIEEAETIMADLEKVGIDMPAITEKLQEDGVKAFVDSLEQLLNALDEKRKKLQTI